MTYNEKSKKNTLKYRAANIRRIAIDIKNTEYDEIKAAADAAGEPLATYVRKAVRLRMEADTGSRRDQVNND